MLSKNLSIKVKINIVLNTLKMDTRHINVLL
jgi:hypothetical protein